MSVGAEVGCEEVRRSLVCIRLANSVSCSMSRCWAIASFASKSSPPAGVWAGVRDISAALNTCSADPFNL